MEEEILNHFLQFSTYTYPGLYKSKLKNELPGDIREIGLLVRESLIHRSTLARGNTGTNADLRFGDMKQVPWWRQPEDDILITAAAMLAELYRRDDRGFSSDRKPADKLVLTCRFTSVLMAAILKSKDIPTRCRAGHASYFAEDVNDGLSWDHWINQYWDEKENRWITIDVDGSLSLGQEFDPYDMPEGKFDFAADAWLKIRAGQANADRFANAGGMKGAIVVLWSLFHDFHSLMNNEIIYTYGPMAGYAAPEKFKNLTEEELAKIDNLAKLMQDPDKNFGILTSVWNKDRDLRLLAGGLL